MSAKPTKIVDSHQHVFWHYRDDAGLIADMDAHAINYAWLLSWEILPFEHSIHYAEVLNPTRVRTDGTLEGIPLDDLFIAKNNYPDRFVLGFCPHPLRGDAPARLKSAAAIHKVKVCGEWKFRIPFDDPRSINLFRTAGELGLPVVLHLDIPFKTDENGRPEYIPSWYGGTVDNLERALIACPDTTFIGHAPGFWREITAHPDAGYNTPIEAPGRIHQLLDKHENLMADISAGSGRNALQRDSEHAKKFLKTYSKRILFGRDYYGTDLHDFLKTLDLDQEITEDIYWRNAERLVSP